MMTQGLMDCILLRFVPRNPYTKTTHFQEKFRDRVLKKCFILFSKSLIDKDFLLISPIREVVSEFKDIIFSVEIQQQQKFPAVNMRFDGPYFEQGSAVGRDRTGMRNPGMGPG